MSATLGFYIGLLGSLAITVVMAASSRMSVSDWRYLLSFSVLALVLELYTVRVKKGQTLSFSAAAQLIALFVGGPPVAIWTAAVSSLASGLILARRSEQILYNASQDILSIHLASLTFEATGGRYGGEFVQLASAAAGGVTLMMANVVFLSILFSILQGKPFLESVRKILTRQAVMSQVSGHIVAIMSAVLVSRGSLYWLVLTVGLFLLLRASLKEHVDLLAEAEERGRELEAILNSVGSGVLVTDERGFVRHLNGEFRRLIGLDETRPVPTRLDELRVLPGVRNLFPNTSTHQPRECADARTVIRTNLAGPRYLEVFRGRVVDPDQETTACIHVFTDVTILKEAEEQLRRAHEATLRTLTAAIDARDPYTFGHSARVAEYTVAIAQQMGLSPQDIERLRYATLLHDIGKLGVDDRVLRKRGPLNAAERAAMMEHPVIGAQLLEKAGVFREVVDGVRHHHEWYNGGGYPEGLAGEAIPLDARIIGVADAFDAMTSDRPYRPALSPAQALAQLQEGQRVQFDPEVVEAFTRAFEAGEIEVAARVAPPVPAPSLDEAVPVQEGASALAPGVIRPVHHKEITLLYRIVRETDVRTRFPQVLHAILGICAETIGEYTYMVYLWEAGVGALHLAAAVGPGGQAAVPDRLGEGVTVPEHVARTERPLVVSGRESDSGPALVLPTSHTACAIPIRYGGSTVGVLAVESPLPGAIGADEMYLLDSVRHVLGIALWLGRYQEQLAHAASHDGLTGILNHSAFYARLDAALESARRTGEPVAVALLDVDGLKAVNDAYGHLAGDEALREWAELLRDLVPQGGHVARYGGDEFALILPGVSREEATELAERIDREARRTFRVGKRSVRLPRASAGVAVFPDDGRTPRELVDHADRLLYRRKLPGEARRSERDAVQLGTRL